MEQLNAIWVVSATAKKFIFNKIANLFYDNYDLQDTGKISNFL